MLLLNAANSRIRRWTFMLEVITGLETGVSSQGNPVIKMDGREPNAKYRKHARPTLFIHHFSNSRPWPKCWPERNRNELYRKCCWLFDFITFLFIMACFHCGFFPAVCYLNTKLPGFTGNKHARTVLHCREANDSLEPFNSVPLQKLCTVPLNPHFESRKQLAYQADDDKRCSFAGQSESGFISCALQVAL